MPKGFFFFLSLVFVRGFWGDTCRSCISFLILCVSVYKCRRRRIVYNLCFACCLHLLFFRSLALGLFIMIKRTASCIFLHFFFATFSLSHFFGLWKKKYNTNAVDYYYWNTLLISWMWIVFFFLFYFLLLLALNVALLSLVRSSFGSLAYTHVYFDCILCCDNNE